MAERLVFPAPPPIRDTGAENKHSCCAAEFPLHPDLNFKDLLRVHAEENRLLLLERLLRCAQHEQQTAKSNFVQDSFSRLQPVWQLHSSPECGNPTNPVHL